MNLTTFMLLFILILAGIIVFIVRYGGIKISFHSFRWMAGIYGLILAAGLVFLYVMPVDQHLQDGETNPQAADTNNFYELGKQGQYDQTEGIHQIDQQVFHYRGEQLKVNNNQGIMIFAERKSADDGIVTARFYTNVRVNGSDFSDKINPPLLSLYDGILDISVQSQQDFEYYNLEYELPIRQFLPAAQTELRPNRIMHMDVALYLEVPKSMQVEGIDTDIQFVNAEGK